MKKKEKVRRPHADSRGQPRQKVLDRCPFIFFNFPQKIKIKYKTELLSEKVQPYRRQMMSVEKAAQKKGEISSSLLRY